MGGGAIRAAAKVAGIAAANGGLRNVASDHYTTFRKAASARTDMKLMMEGGFQMPCLEMDDWVFAGAEEAADRLPRAVFAGVPTVQEAKEATSELSAALEKTYLSSPVSVVIEGSVGGDLDSNKHDAETKACITSQMAAATVPATAVMAFRFLNESPQARNVVASIACDQNVWNAVLQNEELQQFLQSQIAYESFTMGSDADCDPKSSTDSSKLAELGGLVNVFDKWKSSVVDMVSNLSGYLQNLFGAQGSSGVLLKLNSDGSGRVEAETAMHASFMGLAVITILVILLKRADD